MEGHTPARYVPSAAQEWALSTRSAKTGIYQPGRTPDAD